MNYFILKWCLNLKEAYAQIAVIYGRPKSLIRLEESAYHI